MNRPATRKKPRLANVELRNNQQKSVRAAKISSGSARCLLAESYSPPTTRSTQTRLDFSNVVSNEICVSQEDKNPMTKLRWLLAIPVMLAATLMIAPATAEAATIRDRGGMFSKDALQQAKALLDKIERSSGVPIVIETIDAIPGLPANAPAERRRRAIDDLAVERDKAIGDEGIYLLMSKRDHVMSHVLVRKRLADVLPIEKRDAIRDAFVADFKKEGGYDTGLLDGAAPSKRLSREFPSAGAAVAAHGGGVERAPRRADGGRMPAGRSTFGAFLMIILGIFGVLLVLRLIGGLFNRNAGQGYPGAGGMGCARTRNGGRAGLWRVRLRRTRGRILLRHAGRARRSACRQLAIRPVHRRPARTVRLG